MKTSLLPFSVLLLAVVALLFPSSLRADFRTGRKADLVLNALPRPEMCALSVAVDPLSQKVFVCDTMSSRVLRFTADAAMSNGEPEAIFGQPDAITLIGGTSATCMNHPRGITVDTLGRLWVADTGNNRILRFDNASALPTGAAASGLLGQADFQSAVSGTAENRLYGPTAVAMDLSGRLWVADESNHRILRWDNAGALSSGAFASGVLGQPNFTTSTEGTSATKLRRPSVLTLEHSSGVLVRLWVGDEAARVLAFNNPATKPNGGAADKVLGQADFTTSFPVQPISAAGMYGASGLVMQGTDLWVSDMSLNRVVRFANAGTKANGAAADAVLGQFNFAEFGAGESVDRLWNPAGLAVLGARLWIADGGNCRIVRHEGATGKLGLAPADGVLGGRVPRSTRQLIQARDLAVDPNTGKLFVSEMNKNRVLRYASVTALQTGSEAEAVLGQPDFLTTDSGTSATKLKSPSGLHVDILGNLWVADYENSRVLRFAGASTLPNGAAASQVLGSPNFTSGASNTTVTGMYGPTAVVTEWALNASFRPEIRRLWVADTNHHRVLRFDNPLTAGNGAAASGVLGQPNFTTSNVSNSVTGMHAPGGLAVETNGRLWVVDGLNRRVLRYEAAASKANGGAADGVLIQPAFGSITVSRHPSSVAVTPQGRLFVGLYGANRVIWFNNAAAKANGAAEDGVLGQPGISASDTSPPSRELYDPASLALDPAGSLWVADAFYVKRFSPSIESMITGYGFSAQNRFFLNILGTGGETYQIRSSTDLQNWDTIEATQTVPGTTTQVMTWTASAPPDGPRKFYRLQLP